MNLELACTMAQTLPMMPEGGSAPFVVEVSIVSPMSRMAALVISLPLLGCASAQHEATLRGTCDAIAMKRRALVTRRTALVADMNRDVALGQDGGVPGRSFDDQSTLNADAYVRRVKETWTTTDRALRDTARDLDRERQDAGCPSL